MGTVAVFAYLSVEQCLADIKRCCERSSQGPGHSTGDDMSEGVVGAFRVGGVLHCFINYEVDTLERDVHEDLCAVGSVERSQALRPVHLHRAV